MPWFKTMMLAASEAGLNLFQTQRRGLHSTRTKLEETKSINKQDLHGLLNLRDAKSAESPSDQETSQETEKSWKSPILNEIKFRHRCETCIVFLILRHWLQSIGKEREKKRWLAGVSSRYQCMTLLLMSMAAIVITNAAGLTREQWI